MTDERTDDERKQSPVVFQTLVLCALAGSVPSAVAKDYVDSRGAKISFPLGEASFADEVVSFVRGKPSASEQDSQASRALASPDYDGKQNYVTLGCAGTLTLRFADNALVDVPGPDLYVFEIGPDVEPTDLSVSVDGNQQIHVGRIAGGSAEVDIAAVARKGDAFHFVELKDAMVACGSEWPGADIDAVGAIGSGLVISLKSAVLFDVDRWALKPTAREEISEAARQIQQYPGATMIIDGHTDSSGSNEYNQTLSERRARSVRDHLVSVSGLDETRMQVHGYGKTRPIVRNDTEEGRERNRRVEIVVIPYAGTQEKLR